MSSDPRAANPGLFAEQPLEQALASGSQYDSTIPEWTPETTEQEEGHHLPESQHSNNHQTCRICYEEDIEEMVTIAACRHEFCKSCLQQYLTTQEENVMLARDNELPICPMGECSCKFQADETTDILGRDFHSNRSAPFHGTDAGNRAEGRGAIDEAFRIWALGNNAKECGGCGSYLIKSDGCNKMQCLCGYRFCYQCGSAGARCHCDVGHGFYDNTMRRPDFAATVSATMMRNELEGESLGNCLRRQVDQLTPMEAFSLEGRRRRERWYQQRQAKSLARKAKIIQRIIQNDVDLAVELYHLELESMRGTTPVWAGELTPYLIFLGKNEVQDVFPGVPCPEMYFPGDNCNRRCDEI